MHNDARSLYLEVDLAAAKQTNTGTLKQIHPEDF